MKSDIQWNPIDTQHLDQLEDPKAMILELAKHINRQVGQHNKFKQDVERAMKSASSQTLIVSGGASGSSGGTVTLIGYGAKEVALVPGLNTIPFGFTFSGSFVLGVLRCVGYIEGELQNIDWLIDPTNITPYNFKVKVDAACSLSYFAVPSV